MKIGFISYNAYHLKTEQVLTAWQAGTSTNTLTNSRLYLLPFQSRPTRQVVFNHRPEQSRGAHPTKIASRIGLEYCFCAGTQAIPEGMDFYVVLGAGILPAPFVDAERVVNAHPGLIPYSRGLDSFKWAIYYLRRVGVTLHRLSYEIDMGAAWEWSITPVTANDTLETFARRHYDLEIQLLSRFEHLINNEPTPIDIEKASRATMRMPADKEATLARRFDDYKAKYLGSA